MFVKVGTYVAPVPLAWTPLAKRKGFRWCVFFFFFLLNQMH